MRNWLYFLISLGIVVLSALNKNSSMATNVPLIPRSVIFGNPERFSPQISPDGSKIAYIAPHKGVLNIWLRTRGDHDDALLTFDTNRGISTFYWAYDNKHILYVQDTGGDENWHLYSVDIETKEIRDYTPFNNIQTRLYALDKKHPNELILGLNKENPELHDVYRLKLDSGELIKVVENTKDLNALAFYTDQELQIRLATTILPDGSKKILMRDNDTAPWRDFIHWTNPDDADVSNVIGFNSEGTKVYINDARDSNTIRGKEIDIATGKETTIAHDPAVDLEGFIFDIDTEEPIAAIFDKERKSIIFYDENLKKDYEFFETIDTGDISILNTDLAFNFFIIAFSKDNGPIAYYIYDRSTKTTEFLFYSRPILKEYVLATQIPISFESRDGLTIYGYLTQPVGKEHTPTPLIINVHGGPWVRDRWGYNAEVQWLANRGYSVLQLNYRGSRGYGKDFMNAGNKEWGGKMHNDLLDGVQWALKNNIALPGKIAIYGGSYGGYAALVGATMTPDVFCCAVDIVGISNLITFLQTLPPYWKIFKESTKKRIGDIESDAEFLKSRSPLTHIDNLKIPLLIGHGKNDPRVKESEAEQFVAALIKKNIPYEYIVFNDEGHGFAKPQNRMVFYKATERFLATHLGGRYEA